MDKINSLSEDLQKLKDLNKQIEEANKNFKKMSASQKRVAIAKDVIDQLKKENYTAVTNSYLTVFAPENNTLSAVLSGTEKVDDTSGVVSNIDAAALFCDTSTTCTCCARAAMFVSSVRKFDNLKLGEVDIDYLYPQDKIELELENFQFEHQEVKFFTPLQILMIESCYERANLGHKAPKGIDAWSKNNTILADASALYGKSLSSNAKERMIQIMKNIIKNKGTFVVPDKFIKEARDDWNAYN